MITMTGHYALFKLWKAERWKVASCLAGLNPHYDRTPDRALASYSNISPVLETQPRDVQHSVALPSTEEVHTHKGRVQSSRKGKCREQSFAVWPYCCHFPSIEVNKYKIRVNCTAFTIIPSERIHSVKMLNTWGNMRQAYVFNMFGFINNILTFYPLDRSTKGHLSPVWRTVRIWAQMRFSHLLNSKPS